MGKEPNEGEKKKILNHKHIGTLRREHNIGVIEAILTRREKEREGAERKNNGKWRTGIRTTSFYVCLHIN